ncbi:hypothetical protein [Paeniglutamicibacter kerguelensis]|uniref:Uncharacterized protein n=1 Tax=Paeniglutamicibacter kerguelensis TaxID=254788 RepID=A0ABS4XCQ7_9MICC|nr:hypothetical protein [Paeniglutamicibacter kerguelensis]MBP2386178.1 hypothetical protein [Paeniglutamicibacter kerguelensis]
MDFEPGINGPWDGVERFMPPKGRDAQALRATGNPPSFDLAHGARGPG